LAVAWSNQKQAWRSQCRTNMQGSILLMSLILLWLLHHSSEKKSMQFVIVAHIPNEPGSAIRQSSRKLRSSFDHKEGIGEQVTDGEAYVGVCQSVWAVWLWRTTENELWCHRYLRRNRERYYSCTVTMTDDRFFEKEKTCLKWDEWMNGSSIPRPWVVVVLLVNAAIFQLTWRTARCIILYQFYLQ
jgi:hypothetical protein